MMSRLLRLGIVSLGLGLLGTAPAAADPDPRALCEIGCGITAAGIAYEFGASAAANFLQGCIDGCGIWPG